MTDTASTRPLPRALNKRQELALRSKSSARAGTGPLRPRLPPTSRTFCLVDYRLGLQGPRGGFGQPLVSLRSRMNVIPEQVTLAVSALPAGGGNVGKSDRG